MDLGLFELSDLVSFWWVYFVCWAVDGMYEFMVVLTCNTC